MAANAQMLQATWEVPGIPNARHQGRSPQVERPTWDRTVAASWFEVQV